MIIKEVNKIGWKFRLKVCDASLPNQIFDICQLISVKTWLLNIKVYARINVAINPNIKWSSVTF